MHAVQRAILDPAHRVFVNHEIAFFSSTARRKLFPGDPRRTSGGLTDPVSGLRFRPGKTAPPTKYEGRDYFFTSAETEATFKMDPAMYQDAKRVMPKAVEQPAAASPDAPSPAAPLPGGQAPATKPGATG